MGHQQPGNESLIPEPVQVVTQKGSDPSAQLDRKPCSALRGVLHDEVWRYVKSTTQAFNPDCFNAAVLMRKGLVDGVAEAGRGNTVFFTLDGQPLVLRDYHRGGMIRYISRSRYVFTGMHRTRALREFDMLLHLHELSLPAPRPYACRVQRFGLFYEASLVTHRLAGSTLAHRLACDGRLAGDVSTGERLWRKIGHVIACFHSAGVYHADLNAHNIMIDNDASVTLLDFDRSRLQPVPRRPADSGWCLQNLDRLQRSIAKIASRNSPQQTESRQSDVVDEWWRGFSQCKEKWRESMSEQAASA